MMTWSSCQAYFYKVQYIYIYIFFSNSGLDMHSFGAKSSKTCAAALQRFTPGFTSSAGGDVAAVVKPTHRNAWKPWEQRVQYIWFLKSLKLPEDLKDFEVQGYHSVAQRFPNKLPDYRIIPGTKWNIQQAYKNAIELHCSGLEIYEIYSDLLYSSLVIFQFCSIYAKDL